MTPGSRSPGPPAPTMRSGDDEVVTGVKVVNTMVEVEPESGPTSLEWITRSTVSKATPPVPTSGPGHAIGYGLAVKPYLNLKLLPPLTQLWPLPWDPELGKPRFQAVVVAKPGLWPLAPNIPPGDEVEDANWNPSQPTPTPTVRSTRSTLAKKWISSGPAPESMITSAYRSY